MSVFFKKNVGNVWTLIEVSDAEVAAIEKSNFQANVRIAANVARYLPSLLQKQLGAESKDKFDPEVVKALIPVFVDKMTTPIRYAIENYVDSNLAKETTKS